MLKVTFLFEAGVTRYVEIHLQGLAVELGAWGSLDGTLTVSGKSQLLRIFEELSCELEEIDPGNTLTLKVTCI